MGNSPSGPEEHTVTPTGGTGPEIFLNIYIPTENKQKGVYHTGIQIGSTEYAYGGGSVAETGVYKQQPQEEPAGGQWAFEQSISLGKAKLDYMSCNSAISDLKVKFPADQYNVIRKNCNHFTEAAAKVLGVYINYPQWVNRLARMGTSVGMGEGEEVQVEEAKTVFESTQGHKLQDDSDKKKKENDVPIDPRTGKPNPWLKK